VVEAFRERLEHERVEYVPGCDGIVPVACLGNKILPAAVAAAHAADAIVVVLGLAFDQYVMND